MGRRAVGDDIAILDPVTDLHQWALDDAGGLVRALELGQAVNLDPGFGVGGEVHFPDHDTAGVDLVDHARALGNHGCAGIAGNGGFHAGADERRLGADQRNGLPHHVRAHQGAVGVVVLQERHQRRGDGDQLLGRYVDQVDVGGQGHHEFAVGPRGDEVFGQLALGVDRGVGLSDGEALLLHGREVDDLVGDLTLLNLAVRGFNEAVLVDAGVSGQRVDQADVRAFRCLDRANPAVVGRVHVADFEARTLTGQAARPQRRQATLVGDFRERVGLVHELRKLRGPEEFTHGSGGWLGVDHVLRHDGVYIDRRHTLLNRALHAQQAEAVLVFHQLADRTDPAVAEVVDVVDIAATVLHLAEHAQDFEHVFLAQHANGVFGLEALDLALTGAGGEAHVHLHPADGGQVEAFLVEEQAREQRLSGFQRRRLTRAHDPVDVDQGFFTGRVLVDRERVAQVGALVEVIDVEGLEHLHALVEQLSDQRFVELIASFGPDQTGLLVEDIGGEVAADQVFLRNQQLLDRFGQLLGLARGDLVPGLGDNLTVLGVHQIVDEFLARVLADVEGCTELAVGGGFKGDAVVDHGQDFLAAHAGGLERRQRLAFCGRFGALALGVG
ncbi:MAG: Uncharacterised protein [Rhodospirillaceae bacterium]|nr:MAG: Uncharacterised protein [Rhodospirillaceae bacterium]